MKNFLFFNIIILFFLLISQHKGECFELCNSFNLSPKSNLISTYTELFNNNEESLIVGEDSELSEIWNNQVSFHLKLYEIAVNIMRLTAKYGIFFDFPAGDLKYLSSIFDFSEIDLKKNPEMMRYALGFMAYNMINPHFFNKKIMPSTNLALSYDLNLVLFTALISSNIKISDLDMRIKEIQNAYSNLYSSNLLEPLFFKLHEEYLDLKINSLFSFFIKNQKKVSEDKKTNFYEFAKTVFKIWRDKEHIPFHKIASNKFFGKRIQTKIKILPQYESMLPKKIYSENFEEYFNSLTDVPISKDEEAIFKIHSLFTQIYKEPNAGIIIPGAKISKVKKIGNDFFIKRVDITRVNYPDEEIIIAKEFEKQIQKKHPQIKSQEFVGIIFTNGNFYLISKTAKGIPFNNIWNDDISFFKNNYLSDIIINLQKFNVFDTEGEALRERECFINLLNGDINITVLDFETSPFRFKSHSDIANKLRLKNSLKSMYENSLSKIFKRNTFIINNKA